MTPISTQTISKRISIRGVVQGVGFRPFVYQLAIKLNLKGWVLNTSGDVQIEVEGQKSSIDKFIEELTYTAPPVSRIESISVIDTPVNGYRVFEILSSKAIEGRYQLVSPDIATCPLCLQEVLSPNDRRYRYPFTNCTNCGPRFTIIEDIPYDRPRTTMKVFAMCPRCQQEYEDPLDRRFHAQPNACPVCGPQLQLLNEKGERLDCQDIIGEVGKLLRAGKIIAIKGLGGFLLACDATNTEAVRTLRQRKRRPYKPFAIMVKNINQAAEYCSITPLEEKLLRSPQAPIVLLKQREESKLLRQVAPNIKYQGMMLPYTPLHHLLLDEANLPLVMTSGNISEEPIAKDNEEAVRRLSGIADYFLIHNRDIHSRYDDSVTMVVKEKEQILRRARSWAPYPVHLPFNSRQILACGAELKNTFCLTRDNYAFISQHIGDMENLETMEHYEDTLKLYQKLFRIEPQIITCDMHPDYLTTKFAVELSQGLNLPLIKVQHHHAHIASCLIDNGLTEKVIGVSFDGTGYGTDGCIWGGEFLIADSHLFHRVAHLEYLPLPGGAAAIHKPYRTTIAYLLTLLGPDILKKPVPFLKQIREDEISLVTGQTFRRINTPLTSSMGRLFDAVSALLGIRFEVDYEGQAAIELEMCATDAVAEGSYPFEISEAGGIRVIKLAALFESILADLGNGHTVQNIAGKFHNTVCDMIIKMCSYIRKENGNNKVALSGGTFQNRLLLKSVMEALQKNAFTVLTHRQVPANDGGISLGQAAVAHFSSLNS